MTGLLLLAPVATLALPALGLSLPGARAARYERATAAVAAWIAVALLLATWAPARATEEASLGSLGAGVDLSLRLDAVSAAFGLVLLVPLALLHSLRPQAPAVAAMTSLAAAAGLVAVEAGGMVLCSAALGVAATVLATLGARTSGRLPWMFWLSTAAAVFGLAWVGVTLQVTGGTDQFTAVPVSSLTSQLFGLVAVAALFYSGMLPGRTWLGLASASEQPAGAGAAAVVLPAGLYLLVRMYVVGDGRWPSAWLDVALAVTGAAITLSAALRAQAALSRGAHLAEQVPGLAGFALLAMAVGTPFGLAAAILTIVALALMLVLIPLLPERTTRWSVFAVALLVGVPPSICFYVRLLDIQAALEAGEVTAFVALLAAGAWLIGLAAASRAQNLPWREAVGWNGRAAAVAGLMLAAGIGLGTLQVLLAAPILSEVQAGPGAGVAGGLGAVSSRSGTLPALTLGLPLAVLLAVGLSLGGRLQMGLPTARSPLPRSLVPLPRIDLPAFHLPRGRWLHQRLGRLEQAAEAAPPLLWLLLFGVLAVVLTR